MENIIREGLTPIGVKENEEIVGLSSPERSGILHLMGHSGQGKSVTLEMMAIADIHNGRGGMLIEPYGDLIKDVQEYIPTDKADKVTFFEASTGDLEANIAKFQNEINLTEMKEDAQKFLLCKIDYQTLGNDVARDLGIYLIGQFLNVVGGENRSLFIDEAHNFINEETLEKILKSKENNLSCILSDQTCLHYRTDILKSLLKTLDHIICYQVDTKTADLINEFHPEIISDELTTLEKYYFVTKLNARTASPTTLKLRGIFPFPFPKK